jgi:hypothetical protein
MITVQFIPVILDQMHVHDMAGRYLLDPSSRTFLTLFEMMLGAGLPELRRPADMAHLKEALAPGLTNAAAAERFTGLIHASLGNGRSRMNNAIHMLARG